MSGGLIDLQVLTPRHSAILRFIAGYMEHHGFAPSIRKIASGVGRLSTGKTHSDVQDLERCGDIRRLPYRACAIELVTRLPVPRAPDGAPCHFIPAEAIAKRLEQLHPRRAA